MARPSREEALEVLEEGHRRIAALLAPLSDEELTRSATIGGGDWSAMDLLAHLATWEQLALEAIRDWREGREPRVEEEIFGAPDGVDRFNATAVEANRRRPAEEVRAEAERTHALLAAAISGITDEEWASRAPYPTQRRRRLAELLGSILGAPKRPFGHAFAHLPDLEAYAASLRDGAPG